MGPLREVNYGEKWIKQSFTEEDIQSRVFEECEFNNCSFIGCNFDNTKLLNCKFVDCDLSNIILLDCRFTDVQFVKCKAIGSDWTKIQKIQKLSFSECLLNYSNFRQLALPGIKMVKCEAKEVDFIEADLSGGNFDKTDFDQSIFLKTNLTKADFSNAINYSIDINTNTLGKTRFSLPEALSLLASSDIIVE